MVRSYVFRSTSVPAASYGDDIFESVSPNHLFKASAALNHLDHLSHQSRRQDQHIMDEVNARTLTSALPPRRPLPHSPSVHHHHHQPISRRMTLGGGGFLNRDVNVPTVNDSFTQSYGNDYSLGETKRMSLAADTAVRQAHREVDRVERELSTSHKQPTSSRRQRSFSIAAPSRASSVFHEPLTSHHNHTMSATNDSHLPSYTYQYESCHPDHTRRDYHNHTTQTYSSERPGYHLDFQADSIHKPLYSPLKLIRCLTDTNPSTIHHHHTPSLYEPLLTKSRSVHPLQSTSLHHDTTYHPSTPHLSSFLLPTHHHSTHTTPYYPPTNHTTSLLTRSQSLHRPKKQTPLHLPESVGLWYNRPLSNHHLYSNTSTIPTLPPIISHKSKTLSHEPEFGSLYNHYYHSSPSHSTDHSHSFNLEHSQPHHIDLSSHQLHHDAGPTPNYHPHLSTTYSALPPRPHTIHSLPYDAHVSTFTAPETYLHTGQEKPQKEVSATRKRVRDVLCRVKKNPQYFD